MVEIWENLCEVAFPKPISILKVFIYLVFKYIEMAEAYLKEPSLDGLPPDRLKKVEEKYH